MSILNKNYWNDRYRNRNIPWDAGAPTTPLTAFVDQLEDKSIVILIPGAGLAHEAAYLFQQGFYNSWVCDWAPEPLEQFHQNYPDFPKRQLLCHDFFDLTGHYDLLLEQTFFCALPPDQRPAYTKKAWELLQPGGMVAGLLFAQPFDQPGPPFGGTKAEYLGLFSPYFEVLEMEVSPLSIKPRAGRELFFRMKARVLVED